MIALISSIACVIVFESIVYTALYSPGIISRRLDLGDFILMGNWTITAVYGHQVRA